jgi:dihydroorotase-like cyclic amidohydrolase
VTNFLFGQYKECRCIVPVDAVTRFTTDHHPDAAALENGPTASAAGGETTAVAMVGAGVFAVTGAAVLAVIRRRKVPYSPEQGPLLGARQEVV